MTLENADAHPAFSHSELEKIWGKKHKKFSGLVSESFDGSRFLSNLLNFHRLTLHENFFLFSDGRQRLLETSKSPQMPWPELAKLIADDVLQDGSSIKMRDLQKYDPAIDRLCRNLSARFNSQISVNLYYSPPYSSCFSPHVDLYNIFIVQLEGEKRWFVSNTSDSAFTQSKRKSEILKKWKRKETNITLGKGDVLYLPEAFPHYAYTEASSSIHLTIGIHPKDLHQLLLQQLTDKNSEISQLLASCTFGGGRGLLTEKSVSRKTSPFAKKLHSALIEMAKESPSSPKTLSAPFDFLRHISIEPDTAVTATTGEIDYDNLKLKLQTKQKSHISKVLKKKHFHVGEFINLSLQMDWPFALRVASVLLSRSRLRVKTESRSNETPLRSPTIRRQKIYFISSKSNTSVVKVDAKTRVAVLNRAQHKFFRQVISKDEKKTLMFLKKTKFIS